jgi:hypothetical protein
MPILSTFSTYNLQLNPHARNTNDEAGKGVCLYICAHTILFYI